MSRMIARRAALASLLAVTLAPLPASALPGTSAFEGEVVHRSVNCERLADKLRRQRDDRTLNAQDFFDLRRRGCGGAR